MTNNEESCLCLPIISAVAAVVISIVIYLNYFSNNVKSVKDKKKVLLVDSQVKYSLPLIEKEDISHDTKRFRFGLPTTDHVLGLPIGQHIHLSTRINDELIVRSYTPVSSDEDHGFVDLVVKVYFKNVHPKFPEGGKMSQYLNDLKIGDTIDVRGPSGRLQYQGNGTFQITKNRKDPPQLINVKKVSMVAGGTGITPMLQLIRHITKSADDATELSLIFANQSEKDILLRKELEEVAENYPDKFKLWYTLDNPGNNWKYSSGFINETIIKQQLFPPSADNIVLMCGPPPMINFACNPSLEKLNYDKDLCFAY